MLGRSVRVVGTLIILRGRRRRTIILRIRLSRRGGVIIFSSCWSCGVSTSLIVLLSRSYVASAVVCMAAGTRTQHRISPAWNLYLPRNTTQRDLHSLQQPFSCHRTAVAPVCAHPLEQTANRNNPRFSPHAVDLRILSAGGDNPGYRILRSRLAATFSSEIELANVECIFYSALFSSRFNSNRLETWRRWRKQLREQYFPAWKELISSRALLLRGFLNFARFRPRPASSNPCKRTL